MSMMAAFSNFGKSSTSPRIKSMRRTCNRCEMRMTKQSDCTMTRSPTSSCSCASSHHQIARRSSNKIRWSHSQWASTWRSKISELLPWCSWFRIFWIYHASLVARSREPSTRYSMYRNQPLTGSQSKFASALMRWRRWRTNGALWALLNTTFRFEKNMWRNTWKVWRNGKECWRYKEILKISRNV